MKISFTTLLFCILPLTVLAQTTKPPLPQLLPQDLEIALALSAAPEHLRAEATVYVLRRGGYEMIRKGENDFHCLVRRAGVTPGFFHNIIAPMCFDGQGSLTLLPVIMDQTRMIEAGSSYETVLAQIEAGYASGKYQEPGVGINYMLSAANFLPDRHHFGKVFHYVPHWMFHASGLKGSDIGQAQKINPFGHEAFVTQPGKPWTFMVIPVGEKERAAIVEKQSDLVARARQYVVFKQRAAKPN